jgi:hypothetical protein
LTVLPLDRGEYSSEIGDCLKNSSFEATTIRHGSRLMCLYLSTSYRAMLERIIGSAAPLMAGMRQHG